MPLEDCRLPSHVSFNTLYDQVPADTFHGEFDFNPFPFDVGMMGVMFCKAFQQLTRTAPMLAPLLDRMTTRNVDQRFKASEALQFFEQYVVPLTTEDQMSSPAPEPTMDSEYVPYDYYDRWQGLDPEFVEKWVAYREPPVPRHVQFLRYICEYRQVHGLLAAASVGASAVTYATYRYLNSAKTINWVVRSPKDVALMLVKKAATP
ncbi:hypothetical protein H0H87_009530, partial [Tephrocybe sp. NHM501043]